MRAQALLPRLGAVPPALFIALLAGIASGQQGPGEGQAIEPEPEAPREDELPELPEIIVTGQLATDAVPVVPLDSVGSRDVFGPEQVRETGARDINDLLLHLPALSTRPYNGGEAAAPSFSARGLPDDGLTEYLNVLIDGVPASPLPYGWTAFSFFPLTPERVHAIDFIRGAHSVRYSPNTVGGVLNFITPPIPGEPTVGARSTFGNFDYSSNHIWGGATAGDWGWALSYVDRRGDGYRDDGGFDQQDVNFKLRRDLSGGDFLATSFTYMASEHQAPGGLTQAQFAENRFGNARPENHFKGYRAVADLVYHDVLSSDTWIEGFAYGSLTYRNLVAQRPQFPDPGDTVDLRDWKDKSYVAAAGARMEHRWSGFGQEHTLYAGARYQREWIPSWTIDQKPYPGDTGPTTQLQDDDYLMNTFSLHADDTFEPVERLKVNLGLRAEWVPTAEGQGLDGTGAQTFNFDQDYFDILPGIGASYGLIENPDGGVRNWTVFANYFQGFRAPQVWGYAYSDPAAGAPELNFEESDAMELGTRLVGPVGLAGSAVLWNNRYDNLGVFYTDFYETLGKIDAKGVDVELVWNAGDPISSLEGLSLLGSITLQDSVLKNGDDAGNKVPYAWETKAAWRARYEFCGGWLASLGGTYVGESFSDTANTVEENANGNIGLNPSRTLWDAQVARAFELGEAGQLRLGLGATNLFDNDWYVHSRGGFFGGGKVAGPPRQAYFSFDLSFSW